MEKSSTKSSTRKAVWLIVLGALLGILLAPAPGLETRQTIAKEVEKGGSYVVSLAHDTREEAVRIGQSGKRIVRRVTHL